MEIPRTSITVGGMAAGRWLMGRGDADTGWWLVGALQFSGKWVGLGVRWLMLVGGEALTRENAVFERGNGCFSVEN